MEEFDVVVEDVGGNVADVSSTLADAHLQTNT